MATRQQAEREGADRIRGRWNPDRPGWSIVRSDAGRIEVTHRETIPPHERADYLLIEMSTFERLAGSRAADAVVAGVERLPGRLARTTRAFLEMLRLAPVTDAPNPLAELIGPSWTTSQAEEALRTSRQNLSDLARRRRAVRLRTSSGRYWWPTFQFRRVGGEVVLDAGIQRLWERLPHGTFDDWELAAWMLRPRHDLNGRRPIDLAATEEAVDSPPLADAVTNYRTRALR